MIAQSIARHEPPTISVRECGKSARLILSVPGGYALPVTPLSVVLRVDVDGDRRPDLAACFALLYSDDNRNGLIDSYDSIYVGQPTLAPLHECAEVVWSPRHTMDGAEKVASMLARDLTPASFVKANGLPLGSMGGTVRPSELADTLNSLRR